MFFLKCSMYALLGVVMTWAGLDVVDNPLQWGSIVLIVVIIDILSNIMGREDV